MATVLEGDFVFFLNAYLTKNTTANLPYNRPP
jgi:hypothetical protein